MTMHLLCHQDPVLTSAVWCIRQPIPYHYSIQIALQLAQAVQQLHALHILHLDIKPQNVLLDKQGTAVLSDAGLTPVVKTLAGPAAHLACKPSSAPNM